LFPDWKSFAGGEGLGYFAWNEGAARKNRSNRDQWFPGTET
jgi:hypothetical protein